MALTKQRFKFIGILYKSMNFKEAYTTTAIKEAVISDPKSSPEEKEKENKKIIVSNDAFLQAEMISELINQIERSRITSLNMRR